MVLRHDLFGLSKKSFHHSEKKIKRKMVCVGIISTSHF